MKPRFSTTGLPPARVPERKRDRRGVALIIVITTVMFLTVLVTDISFGARVRFLTAVHERDEAKAYWLAQTGVNIYRLVLTANKQMGSVSYLQQLGLGDSLWQSVPFINTGLLRMFSDGSASDDEMETFAQTGEVSDEVREESRDKASTRFGTRSFLDFDGDFSAEIRGEECGININNLSSRSSDERPEDTTTGKQLLGLMSGEENDQWLRERNIEKLDLIDNLADWMDADTMVSSGKGGYEDDFYNTLSSPYLAKNAKLDTLQELRLVQGWQDEVYDRWADKLTIYGGGKVNINCADDQVVEGLLAAHLTPRPTDDELHRLVSTMRDYMAMSTFSNGKDFASWVTNQGYEPDATLSKEISTKTQYFTVKSTGLVGDASVVITTVLDYSSSTEGKVLYWRVD